MTMAGPGVGEISSASRDPSWIERGLWAFGLVFPIAWAVAMALFPIVKGQLLGYVPVAVGLAVGAAIAARRQSLTRWLERRTERDFVTLLLVIAVALRAIAVVTFPLAPANDHEMFLRLALGMRAGEGYRLAYGPSAFFPPGMPLLLTGWFWVFPPGVVSAKALGWLIGVAIPPLTYVAGRSLVGQTAARWGALITAVSPTLVFYSATIGYELLLAGLELTIAWQATLVWSRTSGRGVRLLLIGVLTGVAALVKPTSLLIPALLCLSWIPRLHLRRATGFAAVVGIVMAAVILPWTLRNWRVLGAPVLISTNGGPVLYTANNPDSQGLAMQVAPLPGEYDEVSRDRIRRAAAIRWAASHPLDWTRLAAIKTVYTWGTSSSIMSYLSYDRMPAWQEDLAKAALNVGWAAMFVLVAAAAFTTRVWAWPTMATAHSLVAMLVLTHLWFEALSRHHIPVLPILALGAGVGLASMTGEQAAKRGSGKE